MTGFDQSLLDALARTFVAATVDDLLALDVQKPGRGRPGSREVDPSETEAGSDETIHETVTRNPP